MRITGELDVELDDDVRVEAVTPSPCVQSHLRLGDLRLFMPQGTAEAIARAVAESRAGRHAPACGVISYGAAAGRPVHDRREAAGDDDCIQAVLDLAGDYDAAAQRAVSAETKHQMTSRAEGVRAAAQLLAMRRNSGLPLVDVHQWQRALTARMAPMVMEQVHEAMRRGDPALDAARRG